MLAMMLGVVSHAVAAQRREEDVAARRRYHRLQRAYPHQQIPSSGLREIMRLRRSSSRTLAPRISADVLATGAQWTSEGPWSILQRTNYYLSAPQLDAGRVADVAIDPSNRNTVYAGSAGGGVWKTGDGGSTWAPLTDDQCSLNIGGIAVDPRNPDIVYAGTGELNDESFGCGMLRSVDGGRSWQLFGAAELGPDAGVYYSATGAVYVDPTTAGTTSSTVLLVATTTGIFRSTDSGQSWSLSNTGWTVSLVASARDPNILFAGASTSTVSQGGLLRSADKGATWTLLPLPSGLTSDRIERVQLATSAAAPDQVWVAVGNYDGSIGEFEGLWRWNDANGQWTKLVAAGLRTDDPRGDIGKQTGYDLLITVDPTDANRIYLGGERLFRSTDGGASFSRIGAEVHVDWHAVRIDPTDHSRLVGASDGGVFISTDGGDSWVSRSAGLEITMFYPGVSISPNLNAYLVGGTQDNGVIESNGLPNWDGLWSGDGGYTAFSAAGDVLWLEAQWNGFAPGPGIARFGNGVIRSVNDGVDPSDRALYLPPLVMHPLISSTLYFGTQRLYRTTDEYTWQQVSASSDLTKGAGAITRIAIARTDPDTIYVGTSDGLVRLSVDGGVTFAAGGSGLPDRFVNGLALDPADAAHLVAAVGGFGTPHLWESHDAGMTWSAISGTGGSALPDVPANAITFVGSASAIAVGTDVGVWLSSDAGTSWQTAAGGLPNVEVNDLVYDKMNQRLVAATYGRGIWVAPVVAPVAVLPGDLNLDGVVDANDALLVAEALANLDVGKTVLGTLVQVLPAGDANCNGGLDAGDALVVLRQAVGLSTQGSCAGAMHSVRPSR
jgi:hypothetical protein